MMVKSFYFFIFLALCGFVNFCAAQEVKSHVAVARATLYWSDCIKLPHSTPDDVLLTFSQPGERIMLDRNTLLMHAQHKGITLDPAHLPASLMVEYKAIKISGAALEAAIEKAFHNNPSTSLSPDTKPKLGHIPPTLLRGADTDGHLEITQFEVLEDQRQFRATLRYAATPVQKSEVELTGQLVTMVNVPVLAQSLREGETITPDKIKMAMFAEAAAPYGIITNPDELLGMTAAYGNAIQANKPIQRNQLRKPLCVKKDSLVHVSLHQSGLQISAKAKANEDGYMGDSIPLTNLDSQKVFYGVVKGTGQAEVPLATSGP